MIRIPRVLDGKRLHVCRGAVVSNRRTSNNHGPVGQPSALRDGPRSRLARLTLVLYMTTLLADAIRKVTGLPTSIVGVVYVITVLIYIIAIPGSAGRGRAIPRSLPIWLFILSLWCLAVALTQRVPPEIAMLGWTSYVFFVPLLYVGAELAEEDRLAARALRVVAISGAIVGVGAIASTLLGQLAPRLLQPIVPAAGIHTFNNDNIYLAPSIFATAEEASEQLLIALFAWAALTHLDAGRLRRVPSALLGLFIIGGLLVTARRTDIYVAVAGIIAVLIFGRIWASAAARPLALQDGTGTRGRLGVAVFFAAAGSAALIFFLGASTLASFLVSGSAGSRISYMFSLTSSGSLIGQGPGTSTQGATVVGATPLTVGMPQGTQASYALNGRTFITVEGGLAKTWLELGIIGVVIYGAVFWAALAPAIRSLRRMDGPGGALIMLAISLGVVFLKGHQSLDNPLIQPLFWLAVGGFWGRVRAVTRSRQADIEAASRSRPVGGPATASALQDPLRPSK
jgi:hypothetical protein